MKKDIELYELIENYLSGRITDEEKIAFENRISTDPDLAKLVEEQRTLVTIIEEGTLLEIRDNIRRIHNESPGGGGSGLSGKGIILISAIALITALFVALILTSRSKESSVHQAIATPLTDSVENEKSPAKDIHQTLNPESTTQSDQKVIKAKNSNTMPSKLEKLQYDDIAVDENPKEVIKEETVTNLNLPEKISNPKPSVNTNTDHDESHKDLQPVNNNISLSHVDCDTVFITAEVITEQSCEERATGRIIVEVTSMKGATPPYWLSVDNAKNFQQKSQIVDLYPGNYPVWLKDKNNCLSEIGNFLVGSMVCDFEYIFAPDKGERWAIPTKDKNGMIKIYTKQGSLVYMENFEEGHNIPAWDGISLDGNPQPMGVYRFILEFDDGEPIVGNVTIVR